MEIEMLKFFCAAIGAILIAIGATGCGVSYSNGNLRAGTPGYLRELREIERMESAPGAAEMPPAYDATGRGKITVTPQKLGGF